MKRITVKELRRLIETLPDTAQVVLWAGPPPEDREEVQSQDCGAHVEFGALHITQNEAPDPADESENRLRLMEAGKDELR